MHTTREWSSLSNARKAQLIGALAGAVVTVLLGVVLYSSVVYPRHDPYGFPFSRSDLLWFLLTLPMRLISKAVGFEWGLPIDDGEVAIRQIAASLLVNSALLALIATPFGRFLKPQSRPGS